MNTQTDREKSEQVPILQALLVCVQVTELGAGPTRGEVTSRPRPACPPPHMTPAACFRNFPLASGSGLCGQTSLRVFWA